MIVLVGFMGAGKTTVGRIVAGKLGVPFIDSDSVIEERTGRAIRQIFAEDGEPAFRQLEHQAVAAALAGPDAVLALGGGAAEHPRTRRLLAAVPVVFLHVSYPDALIRVGRDPGRPMLARPDVTEVYARRQAVYESVATLTLPTGGRLPEDIAADVLSRLGPSS